MKPSEEEPAGEEVLKDELIAELAAAVDARLESLNLSQAVVWLSGYVVGRFAANRKGLRVSTEHNPLQISFLDTFDPDLENMIFTRENGGWAKPLANGSWFRWHFVAVAKW